MRISTRALFLCVVLALPLTVWAGDPSMAAPEDLGLSAERLERIGETMQAYVDNGEIVGAMGLIARHGKVAYIKTWGKRDRESGAPMTNDTIFRIYSMSKPITSVAVMMLYEEGHFLLQDPVAKYLPELAEMRVAIFDESEVAPATFNLPDPDEDPADAQPSSISVDTVPAERSITVQDLLRHTSGLTYGFFGNSPVDKIYMEQGILVRDANIADTVRKLGSIPLKYQPGTTWEYSVSIDVLGRLVEVLSGMAFDDFLTERIFGPLGMKDTGFFVPEEKLDRFAQMYTRDEQGQLEPSHPQMSRNYVKDPALFSGGGGLVSTAGDYLRFCQMMLNGGELDGARLLSRKTIELMTVDHLGDIYNGRRPTGYGFGLGFAVAQDLARIGIPTSIGEYNWGGAAGTKFWIDPKEDLIGIFMVQILPHTNLTYGTEFKIQAYQAIVD